MQGTEAAASLAVHLKGLHSLAVTSASCRPNWELQQDIIRRHSLGSCDDGNYANCNNTLLLLLLLLPLQGTVSITSPALQGTNLTSCPTVLQQNQRGTTGSKQESGSGSGSDGILGTGINLPTSRSSRTAVPVWVALMCAAAAGALQLVLCM